jgi:hypothetical protein
MDLAELSDQDLVVLRLLVNNYDLSEWKGRRDADNGMYYNDLYLRLCRIHEAVHDEYNNRFTPCSKGNEYRKHRKVYKAIKVDGQDERQCHCSRCNVDIFELCLTDSELDVWSALTPEEDK